MERLGRPEEERERLVPDGLRTLVYRDDGHGEVRELEIQLADGRVTHVERRVRRHVSGS